jgi:uncharacterized membrane protein
MQATDTLRRMDRAWLGVPLLGVAAIAYGIACLLQGDFAIYWQPVPEHLPLRQPLAYLSGGLLVLGGAGLLASRTVRLAAMLLGVLFALYGFCYLLRLFGPLRDLGGVMGVSEQLAVVLGCWAILPRPRAAGAATVARILCGLCSIVFASAHFVGREPTAAMVPEWMPGGQMFWALATGVGHLAVGLGLIANRLAVPATRIGVLMYLCFVALTWLPGAFTHPTEWLRWAGAGISLCMAGALWLVGDLLAARREEGATQAQASGIGGRALPSA